VYSGHPFLELKYAKIALINIRAHYLIMKTQLNSLLAFTLRTAIRKEDAAWFEGNGTILHFLPKGPRPLLNEATQLGADLIVLGTALERQSATISHPELRQLLSDGAASLLQQGAAGLNHAA
jgi:hypothetical protein